MNKDFYLPCIKKIKIPKEEIEKLKNETNEVITISIYERWKNE